MAHLDGVEQFPEGARAGADTPKVADADDSGQCPIFIRNPKTSDIVVSHGPKSIHCPLHFLASHDRRKWPSDNAVSRSCAKAKPRQDRNRPDLPDRSVLGSFQRSDVFVDVPNQHALCHNAANPVPGIQQCNLSLVAELTQILQNMEHTRRPTEWPPWCLTDNHNGTSHHKS